MNITLFDRNAEMCEAWKKEFSPCPEISILNCELDDLPYHDFLITAGNSFGAMSGGIDLAVRDILGYKTQDILQLVIMKRYPYGMPIGDILTMKLDNSPKFGTFLYVPTMRNPSLARPLDIAYVMSVIMGVVMDFPNDKFAIPGLGTGCGKLPPSVAAKAMRAGNDLGRFMYKALRKNE